MEKKRDFVEKKGTQRTCPRQGFRQSYDANFKILVSREAMNIDNLAASRQFQMYWMGQRMTAFGKKFLKMKMNLMRKMTMKMFKTFVLTWKKLKFAKLDFL